MTHQSSSRHIRISSSRPSPSRVELAIGLLQYQRNKRSAEWFRGYGQYIAELGISDGERPIHQLKIHEMTDRTEIRSVQRSGLRVLQFLREVRQPPRPQSPQ